MSWIVSVSFLFFLLKKISSLEFLYLRIALKRYLVLIDGCTQFVTVHVQQSRVDRYFTDVHNYYTVRRSNTSSANTSSANTSDQARKISSLLRLVKKMDKTGPFGSVSMTYWMKEYSLIMMANAYLSQIGWMANQIMECQETSTQHGFLDLWMVIILNGMMLELEVK